MRFSLLLLLLAWLGIHIACASNDDYFKTLRYIELYKQYAMDEMYKNGIPASVTLGQALVETDLGTSRLCNKGNNHFGIKCKEYWTGDTIIVTDDAPNECFRRYKTVRDSYLDHSFFLRHHHKHNYDHLFLLDRRDYFGWAYGLKEAGYATNPRYAELIIKFIEEFDLYRFDDHVIAYMEGKSEGLANFSPYAENKTSKSNNAINTASHTLPTNDKKITAKSGTSSFSPPKMPVTKSNAKHAQENINNTSAPNYLQQSQLGGSFVAKAALQQIPQATNNSSASAKTPLTLSVKQLTVNKRKALLANLSLSPVYVAHRYEMPIEKVYAYNDLQPGEHFKPDLPIFLEEKNNRAAQKITHTSQNGETWHDIAQGYGVKMHKLYKWNKKIKDQPLQQGIKVQLKG